MQMNKRKPKYIGFSQQGCLSAEKPHIMFIFEHRKDPQYKDGSYFGILPNESRRKANYKYWGPFQDLEDIETECYNVIEYNHLSPIYKLIYGIV